LVDGGQLSEAWEPNHIYCGQGWPAGWLREWMTRKTGPEVENFLCPWLLPSPGGLPNLQVLRTKSLVDFCSILGHAPLPAQNASIPPSGNLRSSLINYECIHLHVRSSAKKLDKIDPLQFILFFQEMASLPCFIHGDTSSLFYLQPSVTFSIYSIYSCKTPLGWAGGRPPRKGRCTPGA
jgi:hypothetical protein